jgi:signal transduction histidine kinase
LKGIRKRLVGSYFVVILLTAAILVSILIISLRHYYYINIEEILTRQAEVSGQFYSHYLSDIIPELDADQLLKSFSAGTSAQVQIYDMKGHLVADSLGNTDGGAVFPDVRRAIRGEVVKWIGETSFGEPIMAVSCPLRSGGAVTGVVRFVTSLSGVRDIVHKLALVLVIVGISVIAVVAYVGNLLSNTITEPVQELTRAAKEMAAGKYNVRAVKRFDDEVGRLADTFNYMAEQISYHEKMKNDFIASISHELRTPLTSIKGWAVTLSAGSDLCKEETGEGLKIIEKETDRLTKLVDELLDFSKLASGETSLNLEPVNVEELIGYVTRQMSQRAYRQGLRICAKYEEGIPTITADKNRLKQVLINILDNSLKFTPSGGSICISAGSKDGQIIIQIEDTGCGINAADLPNITKKFYKTDNRACGSGLGLAVCEEIIELHGGHMTIKSEQGRGTTATFTLPVS